MMTKVPNTKHLLTAAAIAFFMLLTRGSHVLTAVSLPDASLVLFLLGGLNLGTGVKSRTAWFAGFFALAAVIDFGASALDPVQGFCLTNGYWGLIPSYGAMWLGGLWLSQQNDAFQTVKYAAVSMLTTFVAFVISTQTYYLFSGRFPANGLLESLQHGWEYLPNWMLVNMAYFAVIWLGVLAVRQLNSFKMAKI